MVSVTIAILCYNYGKYLDQAIASALNQRDCEEYNVEILVIDDGSTDNTQEVCHSYRDRISIIRSKNEGFGATLGKCFTYSTGKYVFLMDADDYFSHDKLKYVIPIMEQGYIYSCHDQFWITEDSNLLPGIHPGGNTSTLCIKRDAGIKILPVQNEASFTAFLVAGRGIKLDLPLSYYRYHNKSMTDRQIPGVQNQYLSQVNKQVSIQLNLNKHNLIPYPFLTDRDIARCSRHFLSTAYYCQLESSLEKKNYLQSIQSYLLFALHQPKISLNSVIFLIKMLARTIFMRPTFPK